jgi:hypothetical protein
VQDRVAEPEPPARVVDDSLHERLVELVVTVRVTVPVKPFRGATVMVEVPLAPGSTVTLVGLDEIVKSGDEVWTETKTLVECEREPLVPMSVTL